MKDKNLMKYSNVMNATKKVVVAGSLTLVSSLLVFGAEENVHAFRAGKKAKIQGVIVSKTNDVLKLRADDNSIATIDLTGDTKIELKRALGGRDPIGAQTLIPGLRIEAKGKGNEDGQLVAKEVLFDRDSMRVSREIGTRVSPLEARATTLEEQTAGLDSRAGQMETKQGQLEQTEVETQQQVSEVKTEVGKANEGVANVNQRVTNLDNYQEVETATVYFELNSSALSDEAKEGLDQIAQQVLTQKAYRIEVAGFADTTGNSSYNQILSGERANAVMHYLEEHGNVPIYRIITPAGMGTSHEAAPNSTSEGRKLNRRVEVKVLVNQGVAAVATETSAATVPQQ
jgi:outer membrane protein OmpA-like peptidoglycan-associated protein